MKTKNFLIKVFLLAFILFFLGEKTEAAFLKLDPSTVSTKSNEQFVLSVNIDTENQEVSSTDIYLIYDANLLEVKQVAEGTFFPTVTNSIISGQLYIGALVDDPSSPKKGTGNVATVTFRALTNGSATLSINCSSSKIVKADIDTTNILDCSKNNRSQVTIGTGGQTKSSSTSTSSSTETSSSTTSSLPKAGFLEDLINIGIPGIILISFGVIGKILLKY